MQLAPIRESLEEACQAHWHTQATSSDLTWVQTHPVWHVLYGRDYYSTLLPLTKLKMQL